MNIRRYNSTYFKHKLYDSSIRKAIISFIDHNRIKKKYHHLQNTFETKKDEYKHKILPTYEEYISKVSSEIMAISLELSVFCILMCDMIRPNKIVDFGSGYSSYIFRSLTTIIGEDYQPTIWSVDDSEEWIIQTKNFLSSYNISSDNVIIWDAFIKQNLCTFDFILYDLGGFEFRKDNLKQIIKLRKSISLKNQWKIYYQKK